MPPIDRVTGWVVASAAVLMLAACADSGSPAAGPTRPPVDPAKAVAATVTAGSPRLLPTYVPPGLTGSAQARAATYTVTYADSKRTRQVVLMVNAGASPPPVAGGGTVTQRQFRGVTAQYGVYDTASSMSRRYLLWQEPGTWSDAVTTRPGIEYFLVATGLPETDFLRIADSLQPVS